jgi:2-methylcitrate dehydratase PrpD
MTEADAPLSVRLADRLTRIDYNILPADVVEIARRCLLDQIGVQLRGNSLPHVAPVRTLVSNASATPEARITGSTLRTAVPYAAFLNAVHGHSCEYDDSHFLAWHPGATVIPAALAIAERHHRSGADLIAAIVAGYEAAALIGAPLREAMMAKGWHGMKVLGGFGAAAAAGRLLDLDCLKLAHALAITASDASGTMEYDRAGGDVKRLHAGAASRSGVEAALLAADGFTGPLTAIEGDRGIYRLFSDDPINDPFVAWAQSFHIRQTSFKLRPALALIHAPLDALEWLILKHGFGADDIHAIDVKLAPHSVRHGGGKTRPFDVTSAQFSLPFSMGLVVTHGNTNLAHYIDPDRWIDPAVLAVADKVNISAMHIPASAPQTGATVTVRLKSGETHQCDRPNFRGHHLDPASDSDLERKFHELSAGMIADVPLVIRLIGNLENLPDVGALMDALASLPDQ